MEITRKTKKGRKVKILSNVDIVTEQDVTAREIFDTEPTENNVYFARWEGTCLGKEYGSVIYLSAPFDPKKDKSLVNILLQHADDSFDKIEAA